MGGVSQLVLCTDVIESESAEMYLRIAVVYRTYTPCVL